MKVHLGWCIAIVLLLNCMVYVLGDYEISSYKFDVQVKHDCSADVTETLFYNFTDPNTNYSTATRWISGYGTNFDTVRLRYVRSNDPTVGPNIVVTENSFSQSLQRWVIKWRFPTRKYPVTFMIQYSLTNTLKLPSQVQNAPTSSNSVTIQLIDPTTWSVYLRNVRTTVTLPFPGPLTYSTQTPYPYITTDGSDYTTAELPATASYSPGDGLTLNLVFDAQTSSCSSSSTNVLNKIDRAAPDIGKLRWWAFVIIVIGGACICSVAVIFCSILFRIFYPRYKH